METFSFYTYKPNRMAATQYDQRVREFIWNFKVGKQGASISAAQLVAKAVGDRDRNGVVLACIPARSQWLTARRYALFSREVCRLTGMDNAYRHIKVCGHRDGRHNICKGEHLANASYSVLLNASFFIGKRVIIFDDLITRGNTANSFADMLRKAGADVLGAVFLAHTASCTS